MVRGLSRGCCDGYGRSVLYEVNKSWCRNDRRGTVESPSATLELVYQNKVKNRELTHFELSNASRQSLPCIISNFLHFFIIQFDPQPAGSFPIVGTQCHEAHA